MQGGRVQGGGVQGGGYRAQGASMLSASGRYHPNASLCTLVLRAAHAPHSAGPWTPLSEEEAKGPYFPRALSRPCVEGPSILRLGLGLGLGFF